MNLYSNKQRWKIALMLVALVSVAISLYFSNSIVQRVSDRERMRVKQWAVAIKKKSEIVEFTDRTFEQLRAYERKKLELYLDATKEISKPFEGDYLPDYSFPLRIIDGNSDIPVILLDDKNTVSGDINVEIDTAKWFASKNLSKKERLKYYEDSLFSLTQLWKTTHPPYTIEVVEGLKMTYYYTDSRKTVQLQHERDSLLSVFKQELINDSKLVPVLLVNDKKDSVISSNLKVKQWSDKLLKNKIQFFESINAPIKVSLRKGEISWLYFNNSGELKQLQYFPYIQFGIIGLFILIAYLLFSTFRKAEQNQVWAGMAKETAHQMGTPLSSLMAWIALLETQEIDQSIVDEMRKDVERLDTVSQRFSKIGSETKLENLDLVETVTHVTGYLRPRISSKVSLEVVHPKEKVVVQHNRQLMEWVLENICRNAVDAMAGKGQLKVEISVVPEKVYIDITDSGKGLTPKQFKNIFEPGFTTKKRGWGLGLTLVKRIVNDYHKGKVFVLWSEVDKGTTFRISLNG